MMPFLSGLSLLLIAFKLLGIISCSWFLVFLPWLVRAVVCTIAGCLKAWAEK